ncbi:YceD family protein [Candidatus Odyssella acanthamoebae]|uniref:DUF177 domain-containing protein n=1 Tax=Candidatus Odyssella acanthamoebae TaxID=91604 RepID=A0A077AVN9_9PROT|nr:YceD family protein [Candidatus Paracaedibacter acanthamoebae]AIK96446.1 hypothetical protein ID47_06370 [Candidatus Paracaedibacter acanthamoebae]
MTPEFSRVFNLDKIGQLAYKYEIKATPEELEQLSKRFNLISIKTFQVSFDITKARKRGEYEVHAYVVAEVVQACIVTLQEVPDQLQFEYKLNLVEGDEDRFHDDLDWHAEAEKEYDLEFFQNNEVDFGEITSQYLSLELNPYPRADVTVEEVDLPKDYGKTNPFTVLDILKSRSSKS